MTGSGVAISATFTAEPLREPLAFLLRLLGWDDAIEFAPFAQVFQTLLDPAGLFARLPEGFHLVLLRPEDISGPDTVGELVDAIRSSLAHRKAHLLLRVCPSIESGQELESILSRALETESGATIVSSAEQDRLYPVNSIYDPQGNALGAIPYTDEYFAALALSLARSMHRLRSAPFKAIAVDCDDTLWSGICGEDGPTGVVVDEPRRALQTFLRHQREMGRLLTIASKNNEQDVAETFRLHEDMPLRFEDFTARRINWESKAASLEELAADLNLGLDAFVFLDDNPKETAEVETELPQVASIALPHDPQQIPDFLDHLWALDAPQTLTAEDRNRSIAYAQQAERAGWEKQARSLAEFVAGLDLQVEMSPLSANELARAAQLTQRTNQMNFTTVRRTEGELAAFLQKGEGVSVTARDRFGDYGFVGLMLWTAEAGTLLIDTFLLSCRALGRGVEHQMLHRAGEQAEALALATVSVPFEKTSRNTPAQELLESLEARGELPFRFTASSLAGLEYQPSQPVERSLPSSSAPRSDDRPRAARYTRIAELRRPADLLTAVRMEKGRHAPRTESEPPRTELERRLSSIWGELLGVTGIGIHDNFFDLGGHSLLAVQLVSRLQRDLAIDLPLEAVYTGTLTVAELARSIEVFELAQLDDVEYASLLADVESLTDEEAEALLERESAGEPRP